MRSILLVAIVACAPATPAAAPTAADAPSDDKPVECDLVCEKAKLAVKPTAEADYSVSALANVNAVLESMQPSILACYKKRVSVSPNAHAYITVDVVIGEDGKVVQIETTGGALLGDQTLACITNQIKNATFDKPHNGGTLHVHVPFALRPVSDDG